MFPTIEELKLQCRIDFEDENELLNTYLKAAITRVETRVNRKLYDDSIPEDDSSGLLVNEDIKLALMLAVNHFYDTRNAAKIPTGFYELIDPYRHIPL